MIDTQYRHTNPNEVHGWSYCYAFDLASAIHKFAQMGLNSYLSHMQVRVFEDDKPPIWKWCSDCVYKPRIGPILTARTR